MISQPKKRPKNAKRTKEEVLEIRKLLKTYRICEVAKMLNMTDSEIYSVKLNYKRWQLKETE